MLFSHTYTLHTHTHTHTHTQSFKFRSFIDSEKSVYNINQPTAHPPTQLAQFHVPQRWWGTGPTLSENVQWGRNGNNGSCTNVLGVHKWWTMQLLHKALQQCSAVMVRMSDSQTQNGDFHYQSSLLMPMLLVALTLHRQTFRVHVTTTVVHKSIFYVFKAKAKSNMTQNEKTKIEIKVEPFHYFSVPNLKKSDSKTF